MNIIGTRLRELRQSAKLSQVKIAEVVGSRQSAIARFESGEAHVPAEVMIRYADYFDVSLDYIFGRTDKPQEHKLFGKGILLNHSFSTKQRGSIANRFHRMLSGICPDCGCSRVFSFSHYTTPTKR